MERLRRLSLSSSSSSSSLPPSPSSSLSRFQATESSPPRVLQRRTAIVDRWLSASPISDFWPHASRRVPESITGRTVAHKLLPPAARWHHRMKLAVAQKVRTNRTLRHQVLSLSFCLHLPFLDKQAGPSLNRGFPAPVAVGNVD